MSQNPQDNQSYPLRLPNYRFLHQGRYHPYPTFNRQGGLSSEAEDVEIAEAPIISTDNSAEARPSTQQGPSATSEPRPVYAADEQGDTQTDLANLAVIVDEMKGTTSESSAPRDNGALVVAFASALKGRASAARNRTQS